MGSVWFCLVAVMLTGYVVLDGFDIGAGALHLWIARSDSERRTVLRSIGSVRDGNEVWLIAAGGTLYFAFPILYASSFSGFYLPLMMVLWLLILRGVGAEFRSHVGGPIWSVFWDAIFSLSSLLLAMFFGAALGNVVRGVPLDASGHFFEPLWTNFLPEKQAGILDWYTILVAVAALTALAQHGAAWVALKTEGSVHERSMRAASLAWWLVAALTIMVTFASFRVQSLLAVSFRARPWGFAFPVLAVWGLIAVKWFLRSRNAGKAFAASCVYLAGMLGSVVFALFPLVLPSSLNPYHSLTVTNAKAGDYGLKVGMIWWVFGMLLIAAYTFYNYRNFAGKIRAEDDEEVY